MNVTGTRWVSDDRSLDSTSDYPAPGVLDCVAATRQAGDGGASDA